MKSFDQKKIYGLLGKECKSHGQRVYGLMSKEYVPLVRVPSTCPIKSDVQRAEKNFYIRQCLARFQTMAFIISLREEVYLGNAQLNRKSHLFSSLLSRYIRTGHGSFSSEASKSIDEERRILNNRILYRSRQRGYLELDLILGKWTEENIQNLDSQQLQSLGEVLDLENPELWKWLTGQEAMPTHLSENPVFMEIHQKIMGALDTHSPSEIRAKLGQEWVRGWDDNRKIGGPRTGNQ